MTKQLGWLNTPVHKRRPRWGLDNEQVQRVAAIAEAHPGDTLEQLAAHLEAAGELPPRGGPQWNLIWVQRMLTRAERNSR